MAIAGVDCGGTLTKVCWSGINGRQLESAADKPVEQIIGGLRSVGVDTLYVTGVGTRPHAEDMRLIDLGGNNPIDSEGRVLACGVRHLLSAQSMAEQPFLLVSVGTGVSFTHVDGETIFRYPIGSPFGSKAVTGLGALLGVHNPAHVFDLAASGKVLDRLYMELFPDLAGSPQGMYVAGHFAGDCITNQGLSHVFANQLQAMMVSIYVFIATFAFYREPAPQSAPKRIVFTGTSVARAQLLRERLALIGEVLEKEVVFPDDGEYAGAIGAYQQGISL